MVIGKDLSLLTSPEEVYQEVTTKGWTVDILINNAGFGDFGLFVESDRTQIGQMLQLNIVTLTHLTRLFGPGMVERQSGKIMNVASTAAFQPGPLMAVYYATKAYVLSFSEAITNEFKGTGVTVTTLCPGTTATDFFSAAAMEDSKLVKGKKLPTAEKVAKYGYKAMNKGKAAVIPGFMNRMLALSTRFVPRKMAASMAKRMQASSH